MAKRKQPSKQVKDRRPTMRYTNKHDGEVIAEVPLSNVILRLVEQASRYAELTGDQELLNKYLERLAHVECGALEREVQMERNNNRRADEADEQRKWMWPLFEEEYVALEQAGKRCIGRDALSDAVQQRLFKQDPPDLRGMMVTPHQARLFLKAHTAKASDTG